MTKIKSIIGILFIFTTFNRINTVKTSSPKQGVKPEASAIGESKIQFGLTQKLMKENIDGTDNSYRGDKLAIKAQKPSNIDKILAKLRKNKKQKSSPMSRLDKRITNDTGRKKVMFKHPLIHQTNFIKSSNLNIDKLKSNFNQPIIDIKADKVSKVDKDDTMPILKENLELKKANKLFHPWNINNNDKLAPLMFYSPYHAYLAYNGGFTDTLNKSSTKSNEPAINEDNSNKSSHSIEELQSPNLQTSSKIKPFQDNYKSDYDIVSQRKKKIMKMLVVVEVKRCRDCINDATIKDYLNLKC